MSHNAGKVILGMTQSSFRVVDNRPGTAQAGIAVRRKSDNTLSTAKADGELEGVSVGKPLSGLTGRTNICRAGLDVPLLVTAAFTPVIGKQVNIDDVTGMAIASGAGATGINAVYSKVGLIGIKEDGTETASGGVCLIDMQGGL